jgi:hypothetical protein
VRTSSAFEPPTRVDLLPFAGDLFQRFEFPQPLQQRVALHQVGLRLLLGGTTWLRISRM